MKITVLDAHTSDFHEIANISCPIKADYCQLHKYNFKVYNIDDSSRSPHWYKIKAIQQEINDCDWLFYCDTDVVILNKAIQLETLIDEKYDLICGPLPYEGQISVSSFLIRNCEWTYEFLDKWYNQTKFLDHPYYPHPSADFYATGSFVKREGGMLFEQSAFAYLYDTDENIRKRIKRTRSDLFTARQFKKSNFSIHFQGGTPEQKIKQMRLATRKI